MLAVLTRLSSSMVASPACSWKRRRPSLLDSHFLHSVFGGVIRTHQREIEEGKASMAEGKNIVDATEVGGETRQFRVLFCGDKYFPTAFTLTRDILRDSPNIVVETLPDQEVLSHIHEYDMCVSKAFRFNSDTFLLAKKLKVVSQFGMGLEGIDVDAATRMGVKVGRIPSRSTGNALSCAEHAIYLILSLLRDQVFIVGYGNIGMELAHRLRPFGVQILAVRPSWNNKYPLEVSGEASGGSTGVEDFDHLVDRKGGMEHLHKFNSQADIVVLCCSLTPKTKGMANESFLASMKRGAMLVNVGRGGLMDYDAVTAALNSGHLGGLGTDVTWVEPMDPHDPILQHPNVLVTPHVAGVTEMSYGSMSEVIAAAAQQLLEGKPVTALEFVN